MNILNVQEKYCKLIKSREKTIELRLFDEKKETIKINDIILFINDSNKKDTFRAKVTNLHRAENFDSLCSIVSP